MNPILTRPHTVKLHLSKDDDANVIKSCAPGAIRINTETYTTSCIVQADSIEENWGPASFQDLNEEHIEAIARRKPELVLLGTGDRIHFPKPAVMRALTDAGIGYEVMDTAAACRTFNFIVAEGRDVAAALITLPPAD